MAMLSLLEIYCDGISDLLYLSINMRGRNTDHVYKGLRPNVPGHAGTRLPEEREHVCRVVHSRDYSVYAMKVCCTGDKRKATLFLEGNGSGSEPLPIKEREGSRYEDL